MLRVLHISYWYPSKSKPNEAPWIKNHIVAIEPYVASRSIHLNVLPGKTWRFKKSNEKGADHYILGLPFSKWIFIEFTSFLLLSALLFRYKVNTNFDVINFHIAYPNLTYWQWIKRWVKIPLVITEHWSAYHFNFGVRKELPRIKNIFGHNIPVIAVSKALADDIKRFSQKSFPVHVIPNVVDGSVFNSNNEIKRQARRFFMVSQWKEPKRPLLVIEAFKRYLERWPDAQLIIGGYGPQIEEMEKLSDGVHQIQFLGKLSPEEIAIQMNLAHAYVHASDYETFSVVCAEAICCGCPVVASAVGGIVEFIKAEENGLLFENSIDQLESQLNKLDELTFDHHQISSNAISKFHSEKVGAQYYGVLKAIVDGHDE